MALGFRASGSGNDGQQRRANGQYSHARRRCARRRLPGHRVELPQQSHKLTDARANASTPRSRRWDGFPTMRPGSCVRAGTTRWLRDVRAHERPVDRDRQRHRAQSLRARHVPAHANTNGSSDRERAYLDMFEMQRVSGVIIGPIGEIDEHLEQMRQRGTPSVLNGRRSSNPRQPYVAIDDVRGGELAVEHLISVGCRHIAFVGSSPDLRQISIACGERCAPPSECPGWVSRSSGRATERSATAQPRPRTSSLDHATAGRTASSARTISSPSA